ncbi:MAG: Ig domain-containing protein, partial [Bacteroidaceae bacterium]|nr:Ig domain-containing protein [Bacteroidaceae bacterium]
SLIDEPLTSLTIDKATATLTEGETLTLTVATAPSYATDHSVTWSSSDEAVATVDTNGKVEAIAAGTATITATANDGSGLTATCKVTVQKKMADRISNTADTVFRVQNQKGSISILGLAKGTVVSVYDIAGQMIATATATGPTVTFDTKRIGANTVIVKAGNKYMKVVLY